MENWKRIWLNSKYTIRIRIFLHEFGKFYLTVVSTLSENLSHFHSISLSRNYLQNPNCRRRLMNEFRSNHVPTIFRCMTEVSRKEKTSPFNDNFRGPKVIYFSSYKKLIDMNYTLMFVELEISRIFLIYYLCQFLDPDV